MIVAPLCSSSRANASYIGNASEGVLIDAGCSYKALLKYLSLCSTGIGKVKAVLITHEHKDHISGLYQLTKNNDIPVYASKGTCEELINGGHVYNENNLFDISELCNAPIDNDIQAFKTSHDSAESVGYTITDRSGYKIAYFTDLGGITEEVRAGTKGADFAFIEANYEPEMLRRNINYPRYIKERIASRRGHLSNHESAEYILQLIESGTTRIMLGHLSKENNSPQTAYSCVAAKLSQAGFKLNRDYTLDIAGVQTGGEYIAV
ncbi:MAG: MBL fold metallo-hydrolase [Oscillospiraceae bacterium]|nr:MBL fold metallo-hydrolase [Oscillospiraceae bacterium]